MSDQSQNVSLAKINGVALSAVKDRLTVRFETLRSGGNETVATVTLSLN